MKTANRLIKEKSPYLLQHAYNPVDWFPWSDEAFKKAKKEDKPVFLSIGYSTCHWCHVMEKESFEDEEIAALLNDAFISIKVDREERPDIDGIYMTVCQMLTGSGGWPLTIVMTPDKKPFFAGTYFPKVNRFGRSGMLELVPRLKNVWLQRKDDILKSADEISAALVQAAEINFDEKIDDNVFNSAFSEFNSRFDKEYGGFNRAPKFPTPHNFYFLLRYWKRTGNNDALEMVLKTLTEMRKGGIYDHIGFGFHRYSTDRQWLVPHFEKMLYDQALICTAYIEAYLALKNDEFKTTADEILNYVLRDMTSGEGAFYSAEDADSEGVEGKFYLWKADEIKKLLNDNTDLFLKIFNVKPEGNWIDQVHGSSDGTNILHLKKSFKEFADEEGISESEVKDKLSSARKILFNYRKKRVHPYKDDKILADWNGLMISAFAKAAQAFNNSDYLLAAEKAADFILNKMMTKDGRLIHRYRDGEAALAANADDYSFMIAALIDLYETGFNIKYLQAALKLNEDFIKFFWDNNKGGFFFTPVDGEELIVRQKEMYDGAVPSANSIAVLNLLRISRITGEISYEEKANRILRVFSRAINASPAAFSQALTAYDFAAGSSKEIVIVGNPEDEKTKQLILKIREKFIPNKIVLLKNPDKKNELENIAPYTKSFSALNSKASVYVCKNFTCSLPVNNSDDLEKLLQ